ncbi:MAG: MarR family winged helix-turn-helix transcriptional regulator [Gammaproteobacteria bacterium]
MNNELFPYMLNRVTGQINQLWLRQLRDRGLTIGRWQLMCVLHRFDGSRVGTIADLSGTEQPAISRVIDQMERDGLVQRRPALDDSRAVEVWFTAAGRKVYDDLLPEANAFVKGLTRNVPQQDIDRVTRVIEGMLTDLQEHEAESKPPALRRVK